MIDATAFGTVGDGIVDDAAAVQSALDTAANMSVSQGHCVTLRFPAGIYRIVLSSGWDSPDGHRRVHGNVHIVGDGKGVTIFRFEQKNAAQMFAGFYCDAGSMVTFDSLSVWVDKLYPLATPNKTQNTNALFGIYHAGTSGCVNAVRCDFWNPQATGSPEGSGWATCINWAAGPAAGLPEYSRWEDCDFVGWNVLTAAWAADDTHQTHYARELRISRCSFKSHEPGGGDHGVYLHPLVAFSISDCRADRVWYFVQHWGTDRSSRNRRPQYADMANCQITNCRAAALITGRGREPADAKSILPSRATAAAAQTGIAPTGALAGVVFEPRAVAVTTSASAGAYAVGNPITVHGTDANGTAVSEAFSLTKADGGEILIGKTQFASVVAIDIGAMKSAAGTVQVGTAAGPYCTYTMNNVRVSGGRTAAEGVSGALVHFRNPMHISNCVVEGNGTTPVAAGMTAYDPGLASDEVLGPEPIRISVTGCTFDSNYACFNSGDHALRQGSEYVFANCTFIRRTSGSAIEHWTTNRLTSENLIFRDCQFVGYNGAGIAHANKTTKFYGCRFIHGAGKGSWGDGLNTGTELDDATYVTQWHLEGCEADAGFSVVNGTNAGKAGITVTGRANQFAGGAVYLREHHIGQLELRHGVAELPLSIVSGSLIIPDWKNDVFHVSGGGTLKTIYIVDAGEIRGASTHLHLIADDAWSIAAGGNVVPKSTAPRIPGQAYKLLYDRRQSVWREI